jgi:hypothetical protein
MGGTCASNQRGGSGRRVRLRGRVGRGRPAGDDLVSGGAVAGLSAGAAAGHPGLAPGVRAASQRRHRRRGQLGLVAVVVRRRGRRRSAGARGGGDRSPAQGALAPCRERAAGAGELAGATACACPAAAGTACAPDQSRVPGSVEPDRQLLLRRHDRPGRDRAQDRALAARRLERVLAAGAGARVRGRAEGAVQAGARSRLATAAREGRRLR